MSGGEVTSPPKRATEPEELWELQKETESEIVEEEKAIEKSSNKKE